MDSSAGYFLPKTSPISQFPSDHSRGSWRYVLSRHSCLSPQSQLLSQNKTTRLENVSALPLLKMSQRYKYLVRSCLSQAGTSGRPKPPPSAAPARFAAADEEFPVHGHRTHSVALLGLGQDVQSLPSWTDGHPTAPCGLPAAGPFLCL